MADTMLNLIDSNDHIIGQALRSTIHRDGLLHREVHIWFITPEKQVVFQKRSLNKDTNPGLLTTAVGGHVELGAGYLESALIEAREEAGLSLTANDLIELARYDNKIHDQRTNVCNHFFRKLYGHVFTGNIADLIIEPGEIEEFVLIPFADLLRPSNDLREQMSPFLLETEFPQVQDGLLALME